MESSTVPSKPEDVTDRDHAAAAVVLPEHEQRLIDAHARNAPPATIARLQQEYDAARYEEVDSAADDDDSDDGLDDLSRADMDSLAAEHGIDLSDARNNADRRQRLRNAGVRAD